MGQKKSCSINLCLKGIMSLVNVTPKPIAEKIDIRNKILEVEKTISEMPGAMIGDSPEYQKHCPLKHTFAGGMYIREIFLPKGMLFVTKIHKLDHPFFILKGDCSVLTEDGVSRFIGPYSGITKAGTKRILLANEDTVWITVHKTDKTDLKEIEEEVIAKTFDEIPELLIRNFIHGAKRSLL